MAWHLQHRISSLEADEGLSVFTVFVKLQMKRYLRQENTLGSAYYVRLLLCSKLQEVPCWTPSGLLGFCLWCIRKLWIFKCEIVSSFRPVQAAKRRALHRRECSTLSKAAFRDYARKFHVCSLHDWHRNFVYCIGRQLPTPQYLYFSYSSRYTRNSHCASWCHGKVAMKCHLMKKYPVFLKVNLTLWKLYADL